MNIKIISLVGLIAATGLLFAFSGIPAIQSDSVNTTAMTGGCTQNASQTGCCCTDCQCTDCACKTCSCGDSCKCEDCKCGTCQCADGKCGKCENCCPKANTKGGCKKAA